MDSAKVTERVIAEALKPLGYQKRALNWYRVSRAGVYQVVNLQKSSWGGASCYLNLGWDPTVEGRTFVPEYRCMARIRAEHADVIASVALVRPDGTVLSSSGIELLDPDVAERFSEDEFANEVKRAVVQPVAGLMQQTQRMSDLLPMFTKHPGWATLRLRDYLRSEGLELPSD